MFVNAAEGYKGIVELVNVDAPLRAVAKAFILDALDERNPIEMADFLRAQDATAPVVILHDEEDVAKTIRQAARYVSHCIAFSESVWELSNRSWLVLENWRRTQPSVQHTTIRPGGGGGSSGGWSFDDFPIIVPQSLWRTSRAPTREYRSVFDTDLFISASGTGDADGEVQEAIKDAIECLSEGLFRPALVVLAKVAEGAWTELGLAASPVLGAQGKKLSEIIESTDTSVPKLVREVRKAVAASDLQPVLKASGSRLVDFEHAEVWTNAVRVSRNAIHFNNAPSIPNTEAKAVTLFLDAVESLQTLYRLTSELKAGPQPL